MLYQAYNQTPSQTLFDFSAKYKAVNNYNNNEVYFERLYNANDYVEVTNITSSTSGYYYKIVDGNYVKVYLPDDYDENNPDTYYTYNGNSRLRYVGFNYSTGSGYYDFIDEQPYYDNPFTFFINGNSNFYGYRVQIYNNENNSLVYDSGNITTGRIVATKSTLSTKSDEYEIYPSSTGNISIAPNDSRGNNVKIKVYLPKGVVNSLDSGPNVKYNWVLTQYYALKNNGTVDTDIFVRNSPVFFVSMPAPMLGLRGYRYDENGNQTYITFSDLRNYDAREIYLEGYLVYYKRHEWNSLTSSYDAEYCIDNFYNYIIESVKWNFEREIYSPQSALLDVQDLGDKDYIVTASLSRYFGELLKGVTGYSHYNVSLDIRYQYQEAEDTPLFYLDKDQDNKIVITQEKIYIKPEYVPSNLQDQIEFTTKECQKEQYIELNWNANIFTGRYLKNGEIEVMGSELDQQFRSFEGYNNGGGNVERTMASVYVSPNDKIVYSADYSTGFKFAYNTQQIYLRYCNIDNGINKKIISLVGNIGTTNVEYYLDAVASGEHLYVQVNYNPNTDILISPTIYRVTTNIQADAQYWQILAINLRDDIFNSTLTEQQLLDALEGSVVALNYMANGSSSTAVNYAAATNLMYPYTDNTYTFTNPNKTANSTSYKGYDMKVNGSQPTGFGTITLCPRDVQELTPTEGAGHTITISSPEDTKVYAVTLAGEDGLEYKRYYFYENGGIIEGLSAGIYPGEDMIIGAVAGGGWDGTPSSIAYQPVISPNTEICNIEKVQLSNGLFDYLMINNMAPEGGTLSAELYYRQLVNIFAITNYSEGYPNRETIKTEVGDVYFLANFNNKQLNGGSISLENEDIKFWEISRINAVDEVKTTVGTINASQGGNIRDYNVPNNWKGYYEISPASDSYLGLPVISNTTSESEEIKYNTTNWDGYSLLILSDPDENNNRYVETIFYWRYNIATGDMNNNTNYNVQETLKRFKRISKSQTNAMSGSLQSLMGYYENGVYYGDSVEIMDKLREIQMANKMKVLKDRNGKNYVIEFTNPLNFAQDTNGFIRSQYVTQYGAKDIIVQPTTIKLNWIEVDTTDNINAITVL